MESDKSEQGKHSARTMPSEIILRKIEKTDARKLKKGLEVSDLKEFIRVEAEDEWSKMKEIINELQKEIDAREEQLVMEMITNIREKKMERFDEWLPKHKERKQALKRAKDEAVRQAKYDAEEYALKHLVKMEEDQK